MPECQRSQWTHLIPPVPLRGNTTKTQRAMTWLLLVCPRPLTLQDNIYFFANNLLGALEMLNTTMTCVFFQL